MSGAEELEAGWQPSFDDLGRNLIDTTFVVLDLETTGGSPRDCAITEIGAVKVRGGEVIGEFQTLINPGGPIPPFITVLTGITDAMVISAPPIGEALFSLIEFLGSCEETVLVAHNAPFDIGFLKSAAEKLQTSWPRYQVIDTARITRYVVTRDEVRDFKLSTLASFFGANTNPEHRALADARATVDVLHGVIERLGSFGVTTLEDLKGFTNRVTDAQRRKRHFAEGLPSTPGVYLFKDSTGEPLYIGTTRNLKNRVRTYFTAAETRKRIHDMIALADRVEIIQTPTIIEAEIRELRLIAEKRPRFNRRSRFQEKAIWIKLSDEPYPRLTQVRGASSLRDEHGWSGPFNGRDEAERAIEALHEVFPIRQCKPRITLTSMKHASPCALLDLGKCGAPCVGLQSLDSYLSIASDLKFAMLIDSREMLTKLRERMHTLSIQERFEEAAEVRNRLGAYIRGTARGERIRSLTKVEEIVALTRSGKNIELVLIRYGRLAASLLTSQDRLDEALTAIRLTGEVVPASEKVLPASTHEEVEVLLRYLEQDGIELLEIKGEWARASFGAGYARSQLEDLKVLNEKSRYKEDFASSFERSRQR
ncbi:MAG: DEDD exonuclease domain-containing protein [Actinobacteria bacterium]|nr:DEDD exonuclease domain-containing protein [Actinomycetota bacterium]